MVYLPFTGLLPSPVPTPAPPTVTAPPNSPPNTGGGVPMNPQFPFPQQVYQGQKQRDNAYTPTTDTAANPYLRNPNPLPFEQPNRDQPRIEPPQVFAPPISIKTLLPDFSKIGNPFDIFRKPYQEPPNNKKNSPTTPPRSRPAELIFPPTKDGQTVGVTYVVQFVATRKTGALAYLRWAENLMAFSSATPFSDAEMRAAPRSSSLIAPILGNITASIGTNTITWFLDGVNTGINTNADVWYYDDRTILSQGTALRIHKIIRLDGQPDNLVPPPPIIRLPEVVGTRIETPAPEYIFDAPPPPSPIGQKKEKEVAPRWLGTFDGRDIFDTSSTQTDPPPSPIETSTDRKIGIIVIQTSQVTDVSQPSPIPQARQDFQPTPIVQPIPTPSPIPIPQPQPQPKPTFKPTPEFKPLDTPNPDIQQLKEQVKEQKTFLEQLPFLIPAALIANQAFNNQGKANAKAGVCEASAPDGCVDNAVKRNTDQVGQKVDAGNVAADTKLNGILGALTGISGFLNTMFEWIKAAFNNTVVDKVLNLLNLITNIHNAAMLSTSIKDTLAEAISLGLATVGIKSPEGSPIDINSAINSSIENLLKGVLGVEQYTALKESWAKANRIIQSGAAVINTARSLYDSTRSLNELTGNNVGRIGNALKKDGVVSENAYKVMSENNSQVNTRMEQLQNLENVVSTLSSITSETYSITENVAEITKQRADFEKNVKDLEPKTQIENVPLKAKETEEKAVSLAPTIPLTELYKPDI